MSALEKENTPEEFTRTRGRLVDISDYDSYFVDHPDDVPLSPTGNGGDSSRFVKQHVYFTEPLYKQRDLSRNERDPRLAAIRTLPYSQLVMRKYMEDYLHRDKEPFVERPPIESADMAIRDYFDLDIVAATLFGLREIKRGKNFLYPSYVSQPPRRLAALPDNRLIMIMKDRKEEAMLALDNPRILPQYVVASALKRLAQRVKSRELINIANERLSSADAYSPIVVPKIGHLRNVAYALLKDSVGITEIEESRQGLQGLRRPLQAVEAIT